MRTFIYIGLVVLFVLSALFGAFNFAQAQDVVLNHGDSLTGCTSILRNPYHPCHIRMARDENENGVFKIMTADGEWLYAEPIATDGDFNTVIQTIITEDEDGNYTLEIKRLNGLKSPMVDGRALAQLELIRFQWNAEVEIFEFIESEPLN